MFGALHENAELFKMYNSFHVVMSNNCEMEYTGRTRPR